MQLPIADTGSATTFGRVCHAACPLSVEIAGSRVVSVRGVADDPLFGGYTCIKGRQLPDQMNDPGRLRAPLRRRADATFEPRDSASTLDEIAVRLRRIIDASPFEQPSMIRRYIIWRNRNAHDRALPDLVNRARVP